MDTTILSQPNSINAVTLTPFIRQSLQNASAEIIEWSQHSLDGGFSGSPVYRFQGKAQTDDGVSHWSIILKVFVPPSSEQTVAAFDYWKREVLIYQSGLLANLPESLIAPRCFAITEQPNGEQWLWLEDMAQVEDATWSLEQYGIAARHLGEFNGAYLLGQSLPMYPWLRHTDIYQRLALAEPGIPQLSQLYTNPHFAGLLDTEQVERIHHLWEQREQLLAGLETLPKTFCHYDAFRRNLIARCDKLGMAQTVALDWGSAGIGALGEELVPLFATTLKFFEIEIEQIPHLEALIFDGYLQGLRAAGWQGDEKLLRFGFTASAALKAGVVEPAIGIPNVARRIATLAPGEEPPRFLSPGGYPQAAARERYLLALGAEALGLLGRIPIL